MRQRRRQQRCDAVGLTEMTSAGAASVTEFMSDGDATFAFDLLPKILLSQDSVLSSYWLLDSSADFHVTPLREWFSTYNSGRLGCMRLADDSACDIVGAGNVQLSLSSGVSLVLRHVHHVPDLCVSLIAIDQLRDSGCQIMLTEQQFRMHQGSLVIARGARLGRCYPMHVDHVRDGIVSVSTQPCRETRRVSFADRLQDALPVLEQSSDYVVHVDTEVERFCSSETQRDTSSDTMTEMVCSLEAHVELTDMELFDMLMRDDDEVYSDRDTVMQSADVERLCSSESQQWESDCSGADSSVLQSFSDMPLPDVDTVMHGQVVPEDADSVEILDRDRLTEIARVSSAFGALMYEMLISRPDIAAAVGAFAAGLISRSVADSGIEQGRAMQVITRYLQEVHVNSSTSGAHVAFLLARIQTHAHAWTELVGVG